MINLRIYELTHAVRCVATRLSVCTQNFSCHLHSIEVRNPSENSLSRQNHRFDLFLYTNETNTINKQNAT